MSSFDLHIYVHTDSAAPAVLDQFHKVLDQLNHINTRICAMGQELTDLQAAVANNTTVTQSAITLIQGIKAALDAAIASGDPAALTALSASLGTDDTALAAAISANTPAAGPTPTAAARGR